MTCICYGHIIWNVYRKDTVATHTHWLEMNRIPWQYIIVRQERLKGLKLVGGSCSEAGSFRSSVVDGEMIEKCCHFPESHSAPGIKHSPSLPNTAGTTDSLMLFLWKVNQCMIEWKEKTDSYKSMLKIYIKKIKHSAQMCVSNFPNKVTWFHGLFGHSHSSYVTLQCVGRIGCFWLIRG